VEISVVRIFGRLVGVGVSLMLLSGLVCHAETASWPACAGCHGANGIASQPRTPHLNGQLPAFLVHAMQSYANGTRPTEVSEHKTFPPIEFEGMAKFYGSQGALPRPTQASDPAVVARGEKIYGNRCADCHGDSGRESDKDAPLMAAQDKAFMAAQAFLFKTGVRKFPFLMDDAYRDLSDDDLAAVAEYFSVQDQLAPAGGKKRKRR
jgi:sulfide dehydrogenase cytochrome subunit